MEIETKEKYMDILYKLIEYYPLFEKAIEEGNICDEVRSFLAEDLNDCYPAIKELRGDIYYISVPKNQFSSKKTLFSEKLIGFLYLTMVGFYKTNKVQHIPLSKKFIDNLLGMLDSTYQLHHSHVRGKIIGFAQLLEPKCYFKIPVVAHNFFRFNFFFLVKGLTSGMWRTRDIKIGGKNARYKFSQRWKLNLIFWIQLNIFSKA